MGLLIIGASSCGGGSSAQSGQSDANRSVNDVAGATSSSDGRVVSRDDYGATWPLLIEGGTLRCHDGAALLETPEATYALNAEAQQRGAGESLAPVWADNPEREGARMSTAALIDDALALCVDPGSSN